MQEGRERVKEEKEGWEEEERERDNKISGKERPLGGM